MHQVAAKAAELPKPKPKPPPPPRPHGRQHRHLGHERPALIFTRHRVNDRGRAALTECPPNFRDWAPIAQTAAPSRRLAVTTDAQMPLWQRAVSRMQSVVSDDPTQSKSG
jgi:hypothetical protein